MDSRNGEADQGEGDERVCTPINRHGKNKGRYRGPGYQNLFSHWRMKNGKWKEHKFYIFTGTALRGGSRTARTALSTERAGSNPAAVPQRSKDDLDSYETR